MSKFNRRNFLGSTASVAAASSTLGAGALSFAPAAQAQNMSFKPEKGAKLRVLRWSRFVQGDIDAYMANVKKFTDTTGIEVRVDNEGWEDVRPKAAVAANTGAGEISWLVSSRADLPQTRWQKMDWCSIRRCWCHDGLSTKHAESCWH